MGPLNHTRRIKAYLAKFSVLFGEKKKIKKILLLLSVFKCKLPKDFYTTT